MNSNLSPSTPQNPIPQKVILFTPDFESGRVLLHLIKQGGHVVTETVDQPAQLIHEIARTTPHLVVVHVLGKIGQLEEIRDVVSRYFPGLPICLLSGNPEDNKSEWAQELSKPLSQPLTPESPRPYADDTRYVLHDESLLALGKGKLGLPKIEKGWEKVCAEQEARFVLQLQTARKNHAAAKNYFACLSAQQAGLDQELAYRLAHGSYKALCWSRDLAGKWLALLAHYVPDTELGFLPIAGTPGPAIDYVHHDMPVEGRYAATLLILHKIKPTMIEAIKQVVTARFDGQDDTSLLTLSLHLYGMAKFLQQVGTAQIELMDAWLDPTIIDQANEANIPRGEHRNAGIYRDFYDFGFIIHSPEPLASILRGFHSGTTYVQQERFLPSFVEFRRLCRYEDLLSGEPAANH